MIPVDQTTFGNGTGNCFQACLASILELKLDEVPNFCVKYGDDTWWPELIRWLTKLELGALYFEAPGNSDRETEEWADETFGWMQKNCPAIYWIGSGPNYVTGESHSCVFRGRVMIFDPNSVNERSGVKFIESIIVILSAQPMVKTL